MSSSPQPSLRQRLWEILLGGGPAKTPPRTRRLAFEPMEERALLSVNPLTVAIDQPDLREEAFVQSPPQSIVTQTSAASLYDFAIETTHDTATENGTEKLIFRIIQTGGPEITTGAVMSWKLETNDPGRFKYRAFLTFPDGSEYLSSSGTVASGSIMDVNYVPRRQAPDGSFIYTEGLFIELVPDNDAIPENDYDVTLTIYPRSYYMQQTPPASCGTATGQVVKDDDNWQISATTIDDEALEPCTWIPGAERVGAIALRKTPGDEYCTDESYGITVEFELGGTASPVALGAKPRDYHLTTNPNGGDVEAMVYVNERNGRLTGTIFIPQGWDELILYVMPDGDHVFETDETVTFAITNAYYADAQKPYDFTTAANTVTILQAPEFVSDADKNNDPNAEIPVNQDTYRAYVERRAIVHNPVKTAMPIQATTNRGVKYEIVSGNDDGVFQIDEDTGAIKAAKSLRDLDIVPDVYVLQIKAYDPSEERLYDLANISIVVTEWSVTRNGAATAVATTTDGCTIRELAYVVGLDEADFKNWLSLTLNTVTLFDGTTKATAALTVTDVLAGNQSFAVPNTIYMAWFGQPFVGGVRDLIFYVTMNYAKRDAWVRGTGP